MSFNPSQVRFKPVVKDKIAIVDAEFQSLTGAIQTRERYVKFLREKEFQSLTGAIQTKEKENE